MHQLILNNFVNDIVYFLCFDGSCVYLLSYILTSSLCLQHGKWFCERHCVFLVFKLVHVCMWCMLTSSLCLQGGYYRNVENATLMAFGVCGLLLAAGCMHALKQWGKQPYNNWHKQWMYAPLTGFGSGG